MHLHLLTLTNFRQFRERTFKFQPGFNLIVGENGAGKKTTLRGVLAALGNTPQMRRRPRLEDDDIRLSSRTAAIKAVVCYSNDRQEEFQVRKTLWESTRRSARRGKSPLILHYQSNEAVCSAMKTKAIKRVQNVEKDSFRRSEAFLYEAETNASQTTSTENARRFGNRTQNMVLDEGLRSGVLKWLKVSIPSEWHIKRTDNDRYRIGFRCSHCRR